MYRHVTKMISKIDRVKIIVWDVFVWLVDAKSDIFSKNEAAIVPLREEKFKWA